jgi:hypothetical protein
MILSFTHDGTVGHWELVTVNNVTTFPRDMPLLIKLRGLHFEYTQRYKRVVKKLRRQSQAKIKRNRDLDVIIE